MSDCEQSQMERYLEREPNDNATLFFKCHFCKEITKLEQLEVWSKEEDGTHYICNKCKKQGKDE